MPKHLTPNEVEDILCFAYKVLNVLRLGHYDIQVSDTPADDGEFASIKMTEGRFFGSLRVGKEWSKNSDWEKCSTIIHECLHLSHAHVNSALTALLEENRSLSPELFDTISRVFMNGMEYMVDGLTLVVQDGYNLTWPTRAETRRFMAQHVHVT